MDSRGQTIISVSEGHATCFIPLHCLSLLFFQKGESAIMFESYEAGPCGAPFLIEFSNCVLNEFCPD